MDRVLKHDATLDIVEPLIGIEFDWTNASCFFTQCCRQGSIR